MAHYQFDDEEEQIDFRSLVWAAVGLAVVVGMTIAIFMTP